MLPQDESKSVVARKIISFLTTLSVQKSLIIIIFLLAFTVSFRYTTNPEEKNFENLDATLHTLFTIQAEKEAPFSLRKFLPLTTLGDVINKNIEWGGAKFEKNGDGIYTSFPPLGFVAPYLFIRIFSLPISINSLFLFNCLIQICCAIIAFFFSREIAISIATSKNNSKINFYALAATIPYLFSTEALYSFGYVYWGQCLFQLFFLCYLLILVFAIRQPFNKKKYCISFCFCSSYVSY